MKTIGLIGGMSWESSLEYYRIINQTIKVKLGGLHSAKILMYSYDFAEIENLQSKGKWGEAVNSMILVARRLESAGADFIVIGTNTMHKLADQIEQNISIPLLHIADATAKEVKEKGLKKVGLLGTRFTMEEGFYKERIREKHGIEVIVPEAREREIIHQVIYNELCLGEIKDSSKEQFKEIIEQLIIRGAEGIILGCTEIPLLIKQKDSKVTLFDTTGIHAKAAANYSILGEER